jgi:dual specificity tyrosine-phosphorylation-regulated kinase 2/3/4
VPFTFDERTLTAYEREELRSVDQVYYTGDNCPTKIQAPTVGPNHGYDDERGDYIVLQGDHIRFRYEISQMLGRGSFGQVARCIDHKTGAQVAVKIIRNKKRFYQQAQIEIRVLAHLRDRDPDGKYGIVRFIESFVFRGHVCITYELLSLNLYDYIKLNKFRPMSLPVVKKIGASILISLAFMARENIIHCDLKPENILLRQPNRTGVKVIDLGSACFENERLYTYIQSRFYRAPEIILGIPYTKKIDLWSYACVLCELVVGYPIFPGENEVDQLACMMEVLGVPPKEIIDQAPRRATFFDVTESGYAPKLVPNSRKKVRQPGAKTLHGCLGLAEDHPFVHFVSMFLRWDPVERPMAEPAMRHPWICDAYIGVTPKVPTVPGASAVAAASTAAGAAGAGGAGSGVGVAQTARPPRAAQPVAPAVAPAPATATSHLPPATHGASASGAGQPPSAAHAQVSSGATVLPSITARGNSSAK